MNKRIADLIGFFDLRKSLMLIMITLGLIALNVKWYGSLNFSLDQKEREYAESRMLMESKAKFEGREKDLEMLSSFMKGESENTKWADVIPGLIADHRLILRQIRPVGTEKRGQFAEEELLVQVDGSIQSFLGFLRALSALEKPIYVSRYVVTARSVGTGFISAEISIVHLARESSVESHH